MSLGDVHDRPGHLIRRCHQIAVALFLDHCAAWELTPSQYAVLRSVEAVPGVDQTTLAGLAAVDRSNVARICAALEARELLHRVPDPADRRARRLSLTPAAIALLARAEAAVCRVQEDLLAPLPPAERPSFLAALRRIAQAHNEHSRAPLRQAPDPDTAP
ncbi:MAG: winged helix-turn-helix transcriptional regulator [Rhodospirillales bacterium]|nr:winged helix-turn-helix transcriptional regulator [Rhodospirillales bacterium]MDE2575969.1 winged helix-turn-helix transcriptional regulator [Rhodospirillales bacterium]